MPSSGFLNKSGKYCSRDQTKFLKWRIYCKVYGRYGFLMLIPLKNKKQYPSPKAHNDYKSKYSYI